MFGEPLTIPDAQQTRITTEQAEGWQVVGWVQDLGWEAVVNNDGKWGRILEDGTMKINGKMVQDKSKALTIEYSGMWGAGYELEVQNRAALRHKIYKRNKYLTNL
jgi:hypothetical protein